MYAASPNAPEPKATPRCCDAEGCDAQATHRAPKGRDSAEYYWFCLEHVRAYNKHYDYFSGMDEPDVQAFMKDAVTGHRPTWQMGQGPDFSTFDLEEHYRQFSGAISVKSDPAMMALPSEVRDALQLFDLPPPPEEHSVKKVYKLLVKQYHPDVSQEHEAHDRFREIVHAYHVLIDYCRQ